ncbi:immunoglobulin superfamily member 6 [Morone saxatilis]|uniref:immunoglobulin superfamily member 6 n=1 Tax=Morone saxatilis TaxID=34816 RepID=UPI0015E21A69|nr:immunoglobulin superfamily member 6 [Morone saxatilis]
MQGIMRSFTSCQATDMHRLIWFSLLLTYLPVTASMEMTSSCLSQPNEAIWKKMGQSVVLPCTVMPNCRANDLEYEWCIFKEHSCFCLKLLDNHKYSLDGSSLHIKSLDANDSGIYYCAAVLNGEPAQGKLHVGSGTTLVVKEKVNIMVRHILLWVFFVLLTIYSLAVVTLILKKYGCRRTTKTERSNSTKTTQFRDVLQEMYSKRNLQRSKRLVSRNRSQAEATRTGANSSNDDVYQNV